MHQRGALPGAGAHRPNQMRTKPITTDATAHRTNIASALDLDQQPQEPQREWQCGELADDVKKVVTFSRPPARRHAPEVPTPLSLTLSPLGRGERFCRHSLFP